MEEIEKTLKSKNLDRPNESVKAIGNTTAILIAALRKDTNLLHDKITQLKAQTELLFDKDIGTITAKMTTDLVADLTTIVTEAGHELLDLSILVSNAIKEARATQKYLE